MQNATATTSVNDDQPAFLLGESVRTLGRGVLDVVVGEQLSWEMAAAPLVGRKLPRCVLVDFAELTAREALSRHKALVNLCREGTELIVLSSPGQLDLEPSKGRASMLPLGFLEQSLSAIKAVLPFEAVLKDVELAGEGRVLLRLYLGTLTVPILQEVIPVSQHLWTAEGLGLYLGRGFYEMEHQDESSYCWMGSHGSVLIRSSASQLVKVELWVEPFVPRAQRLTFGGNQYLLVGKTKVTAYRSIIPGYNPVDLVVDGEAYSPLVRGLSTDSRKLSIKVVGGKVYGLS